MGGSASESPVIKQLVWGDAGSILRLAPGHGRDGSDLWPMTWGDDGAQYTTFGDGYGFDPPVPEKLGLGFAAVLGDPPEVEGINIRSETGENRGLGKEGKKANGLLMVDGVLYLWARNASNAQLAYSTDRARTWTWLDWRLTASFGCPTFCNFGANYAGARDGYVYVYSHDAESAYELADAMVLARVPVDRITEESAYEFFAGMAGDTPRWSGSVSERRPVLSNPGRCYRSGVSYNPGLRRYLWYQVIPFPSYEAELAKDRWVRDVRFAGGCAVFDAPEPWGPWTRVYETERWDVGPGECGSFPPKWMSPDGTTCHLVFSGDDRFCVRKATLQV